MKSRREKVKSFSTEVEKEKFEKSEVKSEDKKTAKTKWLNEKIHDELQKQEERRR